MRTTLPLCLTLLAGAAGAQSLPPAAPLEVVTFDQALQRAAQHATSAQLAAREVARAQALLTESRAGSLPLVSANGTYTRIDAGRTTTALVPSGPPVSPGVFGEVTSKTISTVPLNANNENLAVSAPLFAPSRWYQWSHSADQVDVARASERDVRRSVALTAARAYLTIVSQKRAIEVSRRAVQTAAAHFDYSRTRRQGGIGNTLDEARAEQLLVAGLERAQEALGLATGADAPLDAGAEPDLTGGPATPDEGARAAQERRTDVVLARERAAAAHRVVRDSWADWLPTLNLAAQVYRQSPGTTNTPSKGWQAQLILNFPLFEGGLRVGQANERSALAAEAQLQLDGTLSQARSDVRLAYQSLQHNQKALEESRLAADRAGAALAIVTQAFQAGATTSLDVTDAERTARDADGSAVVAEDAVRQSRLDLLAAVGAFP